MILNNALTTAERYQLNLDLNISEQANLFNRWAIQPPFDIHKELFTERLKQDEVPYEEILKIIQNPDISFSKISLEKEEWYRKLQSIPLDGYEETFLGDFVKVAPQVKFIAVIYPIYKSYEDQLRNSIKEMVESSAAFSSMEEVINEFKTPLFSRLFDLLFKTVILELNIHSLEKRLKGETSEERFEYFVKLLETAEFRTYLFEEYPVLTRQIIHECKIWVSFCENFIKNLTQDFEQIKTVFFKGQQVGHLNKVSFGMGDRHRGGNTVAKLYFNGGHKLIYKPRKLNIDRHFQEILTWLESVVDIQFKKFNILDCEDYGWVEFIDYESCNNEADIRHYYHLIGAYIGILYALNAYDFHYENVIAHNKYPVLIDLECFFHPNLQILNSEPVMDDTILRTGLLPALVSMGGENDVEIVNISGITDVEGTEGLVNSPVIENAGSDKMKLNQIKGTLEGGQNVPLLNAKKINDPAHYLEDIKAGFTKIYKTIIKHKSEFTKAGGFLDRMKDDEIRILFRDTVAYSHILTESNHPKLLRNALERERHIDWLWAAVPTYDLLKKVIGYEKAALMNGDVPLFSSRVGSKDLWYDDNKKQENFFTETGYDVVKDKIEGLKESDLGKHLWLIEASLVTTQKISQGGTGSNIRETDLDKYQAATKEELIKEAEDIAAFLIHNVYEEDEEANWVGFRTTDLNASEYKITLLGHDLFGGLPGEILFFAYLHHVTGKEIYYNIADKATTSLLNHVTKNKEKMKVIGAFTGWGGVFFVLSHLIKLWNRDDLKAFAEKLLEEIDFRKLIKNETGYSLLSGTAGFISTLISYYEVSGSKEVLSICQYGGDRLLEASKNIGDDQIGWRIVSKVPLAGLAHGGSGFAHAFLALYKHTSDKKYLETIVGILNYERSLFSAKAQNWEDKRDWVTANSNGEKMFSTAWSHGAPGIGLLRCMLSQSDFKAYPLLEEELAICLKSTLANGFGGNNNLSFGNFGNLELLINYGLYKDEQYYEWSLKAAKCLIEMKEQRGRWEIGLGAGFYSPGLMVGITGVGFQCLRLAYPDKLPSILTLSAPM